MRHTNFNEIKPKSELLNNLELSELQKSAETSESADKEQNFTNNLNCLKLI